MEDQSANKRIDTFNNPNHSHLDGHPIPSPSSLRVSSHHNGKQAARAHSPLVVDEQQYVRGLIEQWRSKSIDFIDMIGELMNVLPEEDQIQFLSGIIDLMYKKRNNPEEEKQVRKLLRTDFS